jgi:plastocyanin domain-containing protein
MTAGQGQDRIRALTVVLFAGVLASTSSVVIARQTPAEPRVPKRVEIAITEKGFEPARVNVEAGAPVELVFTRKTDKTCATEVIVPSVKVKKPLPLNEPVIVALTPGKGDVTFACGMNMLKGKLVVK